MAFVLLAEPSAAVAGTLRRFLEGAGHEVVSVGTAPEALRAAASRERPPAVVVAAGTGPLDGEALCRGLRAQGTGVPVLLVYPPEEDQADSRASDAGADGCLVGPLKRGTVVTCMALVLQREEARRAPPPPPAAPPRPVPSFTPPPGTLAPVEAEGRRVTRPELPALGTAPVPDFDFLKRLMLMEVKRSRRYRYPIALLLVELDRFAERAASLTPAARTAALGETLGLLVAGVRDIDVAVPLGDSRFVVFLPHTPRSGALVVAGRLRERVKALQAFPGGVTASVGVAVAEPPAGKAPSTSGRGGHSQAGTTQSQVSFGGLLKDASEALRRAQAAGGDRVEAAQPG
jgi:diguanylate cyclase (GGDEF)-like protein